MPQSDAPDRRWCYRLRTSELHLSQRPNSNQHWQEQRQQWSGISDWPIRRYWAITGTGTLTIGDGSAPTTLGIAVQGAGGSAQSALNVLPNSTLNIEDNHFFITYGSGPDPISSIASLIKSGYAGGSSTGKRQD